MIDITPLDVRKKRGDIPKVLRGYDPEEVDTFLELVADRLEELVKENMTLRERSQRLQEQVRSLESREKAVNDALVTAQELSGEIGERARRQARLLRREAEAEVEGIMRKAEALLEEGKAGLRELDRTRSRFLMSFRTLLERELDALTVEENAERGREIGELQRDLGSWRERLGLGGDDEGVPETRARRAQGEDDTASESEPGVSGEDRRPVDVGALEERALPEREGASAAAPGEPGPRQETSPLGDLFAGGKGGGSPREAGEAPPAAGERREAEEGGEER